MKVVYRGIMKVLPGKMEEAMELDIKDIEIDMKNSTSPSNWKTKASIEWQGSY